MQKPEMYVLLWSRSQQQIDVRPLNEWLSANRLAYGADLATGDWVPLLVESDSSLLEATASCCRRSLLNRKPPGTPINETGLIPRPVSA